MENRRLWKHSVLPPSAVNDTRSHVEIRSYTPATYWTALISMHMGRNMCETTAPSRVRNYSCSCVQPDFLYTTCYMLCCQDWFFFPPQQRKINCKEGREFVFILAWWRRVPARRRTAVGEGWPTRCLLPLPCLAAQSLWQNKPPGILGKHWEPLTLSQEHPSQKASLFQYHQLFLMFWGFFFFANLNRRFCYHRYGRVTISRRFAKVLRCKQTCSFSTL